jgi:hypothetical protein
MTDTRKVQLETSLDTRPVKEGLKDIVQAAETAATGVQSAGAKAGKSFDGVGDGAQASARKIETAEKSIIASIQRRTAAVQAAGQSESKYYEELARQRGVNTEVLRPYLQQLDAAKARQDAATASLGNMGLSAKQTAAALRGVPAQFTDIATSLASGQAPLTVLLQQGGQLKDMFGGVGNAARALGGYVVGLINPFTIAAGAVTAIGVAAYQGAGELQSLNKSLILSGGQAGVSGDQLMSMAAGIDAISTSITQSKAAATLDEIVNAGVRGEAQIRRYALAAAEFEVAGGGAAAKVAENFAELGRDPLQASVKLTQSMGYLTAATYEQIKSLEEQGRTLDAVKLAQDAYASALESRTPALLQNLGYMERGWLAVKNMAKEAWDAMLNVGRADTLADQIGVIEKRLAASRANPLVGSGFGQAQGRARQAADEAALSALKEQQRLSVRSADATAQQTAKEKERIAFLAQGDKYLSSSQRQQREILAVQDLVTRQVITQEQAEKRIAAIRASGPKASTARKSREGDAFAADRAAAADWAKYLQQFNDITADAEGKVLGLSKAQKVLVEYLQSPAYKNASEPMRELALQQAYAAVGAEQAAEAFKKEQAAIEAAVNALAGRVEKEQNTAAGIAEQVRQQTEATAAYGLSGQALVELEVARLNDAAAERDRQAVIAAGIDPSLAEAYREQAQGLRDLAAAKQNDATVRKQVDQQRQLWQDVESFAANAFMDVAMNGEDAFKRIGESLKREVIQLLYEMTVKRWILNISGVNVGGSTSSGADLLSNAYSAYTMGSSGAAGTAGASGSGAAVGSYVGGSMSLANAYGSVYANAMGAGIDGLLATNAAYGTAAAEASAAAASSAAAAEASAAAASTSAGTGAAASSGAAASGGGAGAAGGAAAAWWAAIVVAALVTGNNLYKAGYDRNALSSGAMKPNQFGGYSSTSGQGVGQSSVYDSSFERYKRSMLEAIGVNEQWSDILSGTTRMAALFGRKLAGYGFDVDVAGANVGVTGYESYKGGLFRSDKTRERAIDPRDAQMVRELVQETRAAALETARSMGLSTEAIEAWNGELKINFKNVKDAEDAQARYNKALGKMYEDMIREAQRATFDADMQRQVEGVRDSARTMAAALGLSTEQIDAYVGSLGLSMEQMDGSAKSSELLAKATEDLYFQMLQGTDGFNKTREEFDKFIEGVVASAEAVGISSKGISDILVQGMTGRLSQADVGDQLASMIVGGIYNAIAQNYANTIAQAFTTQIITPIFTAIASGVPISQAISQAAIQNVVATAQNAAQALNAIFSDAGFRSAIGQIGSAIKGVAGAATSTAGSVRGLGTAASFAASEASRARSQIKQEWKSIADSIIDEVKRIRGVLAEEQGQSYAFYAAQFAIASAKARAGNKAAAESLPDLSQSMLEAAQLSVSSLAELQLIQAQTAQSLQDTATLAARRYGFVLEKSDTSASPLTTLPALSPAPDRFLLKSYSAASTSDQDMGGVIKTLSERIDRLSTAINGVEANTDETARALKSVIHGDLALKTTAS